MANIINKNKENPKLLETSLKDGRISLYLEYYQGYTSYIDEATGKTKVKHSRRKETLNLYLIQNPKTPADRKTNEENIRIARDIRFQKEQEFKENRLGYKFRKETRINVFDFMHGFLANISNPRNRSSVKVPVMRFKEFIELEYPIYKDFLYPEQLNEDMIRKYCDYLRKKSKGTGAVRSYFFFKSIIKIMVKEKLLK
jgi:hypothetical protein